MTQPAAKRKSAGKAAALSAFLYPGAGQLYNGQRIKGGALIASATAVVIALCISVAQFFIGYFSGIMAIADNQAGAQALLNTGSMWTWLILLAALYLYSVLDAYFVGKRLYSGPPRAALRLK